jgi:hypothetical protein
MKYPAIILILATLLGLIGCVSGKSKTMTRNWNLAEIESLVYELPEIKKNTPFRGIEIKDKETIIVSMGDYGFLSGSGYWITIKAQPNGTWKVLEVTGFDS